MRLPIFCLLLSSGCMYAAENAMRPSGPAKDATLSRSVAEPVDATGVFGGAESGLSGEVKQAEGGQAGGEALDKLSQKLIRTGELSVVVDEYAPFDRQLRGWLSEVDGYVADATLSHVEGEVGWATLTLRVPVDRFENLVSWAEERVQIQSLSLNSQDVTEQWVDVEARIRNAQREETQLLRLLETKTAALADVLAVERELARVRGEIERSEGRMRVLRDQVSMSTLTLNVAVQAPYIATVGPGLGTEMGDAFGASMFAMKRAGRGLAVAGAAAAPWLLPPLFGLGLLVGRRRRAAV